jgi:hypothetical protein
MLSQILASVSYCSSRGMVLPRHTLSLLWLTEVSTKYSRQIDKIFLGDNYRGSPAVNGRAVYVRDVNRFETGPLPSGDEQYGSNSQLVLTGNASFQNCNVSNALAIYHSSRIDTAQNHKCRW